MLRGVLQASNPYPPMRHLQKLSQGRSSGNRNVLKAAIDTPIRLSHIGIVSKPLNLRSRRFHRRIVQRPCCGSKYITMYNLFLA